jgi:hypothetical protein
MGAPATPTANRCLSGIPRAVVLEIEQHPIGDGTTGELARRLQSLFDERTSRSSQRIPL